MHGPAWHLLRHPNTILSRYQDFNFDPIGYWDAEDARQGPNRAGITQAKYVAGEYALYDRLARRFPSLTFGQCAGGGRRIDIEMLRRGQINSRADGFCAQDPDCSQGFTHSLSSWYPRHGQASATIRPSCVEPASTPLNASLCDGPWSQICVRTTIDDAYSFRSFMSPAMAFDYGWPSPMGRRVI